MICAGRIDSPAPVWTATQPNLRAKSNISLVRLALKSRAKENDFSQIRFARKLFLKLTFPEQVEWIAEFAKQQLEQANEEIDQIRNRPNANLPDAVDMWKQLAEDKGKDNDAVRLRRLFPALDHEETKSLSNLFSSCYTFWVSEFYSADPDGRIGRLSAQFSQAYNLRHYPEKLALINEKSGMPYLGQNIAGYANALYMQQD